MIDELINWKTQDSGKSVLLTGAKGVGKTYLAYDFAKAFFERIYYMNLEREPMVSSIFSSCDSEEILLQLKKHFQINLEEPIENRILILDEITFCKEALKVLKKLKLSELFHYIIFISSTPISAEFITGTKHIIIYPMEFDEFLLATSNDWYIEAIQQHYQSNTKIPEIVHKELLTLHDLYLKVGGMPGVVNEYLNFCSLINISEQHNSIIGSYHDYILRDNPNSEALKMNQVFDSLTTQLMKDNKKFQYKLIRKGTTHAMYKDAIQKLCDYNYIINCNRISNDQLLQPMETFQSEDWLSIEANSNFKLYLPDTGILHTKILEEQGSSLEPTHRKALLENYIAGALQTKNYPFAFWESESMAKVDFVCYKDENLFPIEVYEDENTRSKSISILKQKCNFPYSIKISSKNFEFSNQIKFIPYYAVFCF